MESTRSEQAFAAILTKLEGLQKEVENASSKLDATNGRIEDLEAELKVNRSGLDVVKNGMMAEIGSVKVGMGHKSRKLTQPKRDCGLKSRRTRWRCAQS